MNIRAIVFALIGGFCFQAVAMNQEQMMYLIQNGSEQDIRKTAQDLFPVDTSFMMNGMRNVIFEAVAALLVKDKIDTLAGKAAMGALATLVAVEGITFLAGIVEAVNQRAEQEKCFRYFMNIRKGLEMRRSVEGLDLTEGDSAPGDE